MQGKPAQEFHTIKVNRLFDGPVAVIFGNERYPAIGDAQDPLVGNWYPVGILAQVPDHVFSTCKGRFAMHYPFGIVSLLHLIVEQWQFVLFPQGTFQAVGEFPLKCTAQLDRKSTR